MRVLLVPIVVGWALLSVSALAAGHPMGVGRAALAAGLVVLAVAAGRWEPSRRALSLGLAAYAVGLVVAAIAFGAVPGAGGDDVRLALFTGNPNDLGAALVGSVTAWMAATGRWPRWTWLWPALAVAVIYTGSRTSAGAMLAAFAVWIVVLGLRSRSRTVLAILGAAGLLTVLALAWQYGVVERTPNLLGAPNDLRGHDWRHDLAASVDVIDRAGPGPFEGTHAQRLVAQAREDGRNLVFQSMGRSQQGVPYVASVYLRSDRPQRLELSSHLASVACDVGPAWRRCVTPVGYGDDYLQAQLHLLAAEPGGGIDVLVYGAQYEVGTTATPFQGGRPDWIPQSIVRRMDLRRLTALPQDRVAIWRAGLAIARDHPWFGVGLPASEARLLDRTRTTLPPGVDYAHNLLVHLLLVHGLVGSVGAVLIGGALVVTAGRAAGARIAPLLVALALLNTWDLTLFEPEVAGPVVAGLALAAGTRRPSPAPTAPRELSPR
jgi:O-antigen ligase